MKKNYDIIIIGSGLAGLTAAISSAKLGSILLISKSRLSESNSKYAQGGIAAVFDKNDNLKEHIADTLKAGGYHNNVKAVANIIKHAPETIQWLYSQGVPFETDGEGKFSLHLEGGHGHNRIVHKGDTTGKSIVETLIRKVRSNPRIEILEKTLTTNLLVKDKTCYGVEIIKNRKYIHLFARRVILATGGLGQIFQKTTNPEVATGDGIRMAKSVGCTMQDLEFIQFHPTALDENKSPQFLISEAVRGAGAYLINSKHERFMVKIDKRAELAPRDIVSRAIYLEEQKGKVFLDLRHLDQKKLKKSFPNIYRTVLKTGINPALKPVPITPVAHYSCGGIKTDVHGKTNIKNLLAIGEVACTGLHGANRLASNSLLEAGVMGLGTGKIKLEKNKTLNPASFPVPRYRRQKITKTLRKQIQNIMWNEVGIIRTLPQLKKAEEQLDKILKNLAPPTDESSTELMNMAQTAILVTRAALKRKKSLGSHFIQN